MTAAVGAAALLLTCLTAAAQAAPAANPVDAKIYAHLDRAIVTPGMKVGLVVSADTEGRGAILDPGLTLTLPEGVTFDGHIDDERGSCVPEAGGRTLTCTAVNRGPVDLVWVHLRVAFAAGLAPGTKLEFTAAAHLGGATDPWPDNNTTTVKATVQTPADLELTWTGPSGPVPAGESVPTTLVVTNHGPGTATGFFPFQVSVRGENAHPSGYEKICWADPASMICDASGVLQPGESRSFPFVWDLPKTTPGTSRTVGASLRTQDVLDLNPANDAADLTLKFGSEPGSKPTKLTPTASATIAGAVLALILAGATFVAVRRRNRHRA
ncbi:hypothetical protein [Streptomyces sp. NPDC008121]|uniref:hypothetical protein n=1 Tax=Streptomyces sp. NPDC008121 TaxID=3364809 RepID=UPI0036EB6B60